MPIISMDHFQRYAQIIPDFDEFSSIQAQPLASSARINTLKTDRCSLLRRLDRANIAYRTLDWYPLGLLLEVERPGKMVEHMLGLIHIQEAVSMIPPIVLDPQPGQTVLDLCAAPGSKTSQISQLMNNQGLVVANEPSLSRITSLRANCERLGAINVAITRYDGRGFPDHQFDRVLVDAPCSGEGTSRKDSAVLNRCSVKHSLDLQALQLGLLSRAVSLLRPGGVLVYSTCTYAPEENEAVIDKVLENSKDSLMLENATIPGLKGCSGIAEWEGTVFREDLKRTVRYYPHQNDTGGFFIAKMVKE
jgi:NOL1/NOP2/sun family putative RNA methylase